MNPLLEIIKEENIVYDLVANSKEEVIEKLVQHCVKIGSIQQEKSTNIIESLLNRENTMSTGIGSGIAIPHCSTDMIENLIAVMGISRNGIEFNAIDKMPVYIFVMLVVPKEKFQNHIKTLALIAKTLNHKNERDKIISANSYLDIKTAIDRS